jgi:hypothetical protein
MFANNIVWRNIVRKGFLLYLIVAAFGVTSLAFASQEEKEDEEINIRLFPQIINDKFFKDIPRFDPQKDMEYLREESKNRIQGIAESFTLLREYLDENMARDSWVKDSSSATQDIQKAGRGPFASLQYNHDLWSQQLAALQNACCYFLSHKEYGSFINSLQATLDFISNASPKANIHSCPISLKDGEKLLLQTPTFFSIGGISGVLERFPARFLVSSSYDKQDCRIERISKLELTDQKTGLFVIDLGKYAKKQSSKKDADPISIPNFLPTNYRTFLEDLEKTQTLFTLVWRALKVKLNSADNGALGGEGPIVGIAKEIDLIPEHYDTFKAMRQQRVFDYRMPPPGISWDEKTRKIYEKDVSRMRKELEIAEILMNLESDFSEAFLKISMDKVHFWLREAGLIC